MSKLTAVLIFLITASAVSACDMSFFITDDSGNLERIYPDEVTELEENKNYKLTVIFRENHGNCSVPPSDTVFLIDDEKWIYGKEQLSFVITDDFKWETVSKREHEAVIPFQVNQSGEVFMEVIRECNKKEGYDEYLFFKAG